MEVVSIIPLGDYRVCALSRLELRAETPEDMRVLAALHEHLTKGRFPGLREQLANAAERIVSDVVE